jgi:hypothetical protein
MPKHMKSIFAGLLYAFAVALFLAPLLIRAEDQGTIVSVSNLFSYQAPVGWTVQKVPSATYPIATETKDGSVHASISVEADHTPGALDEWCHHSVEKNKVQFASNNMNAGELTPLTTSSGAKGFRVIITLTANSNKLAFIDYYFSGSSDAKMVVTCTCQQTEIDHYAPIFDAAIKTFVPQ